VRDLRLGVDAGVGAAGAVDANLRLIDPFQSIFQDALDGARQGAVRARRLHLPPFEEFPQISQLELQPHDGDYGRAPRGPRAIVGPMADAPALVVTEIFRSLQGESTLAGLACSFVRLTGCGLRCVWCDSAYAFHGGKTMRLEEVLAEVERLGAPLVEVTGGEPLEQEGFYPLSAALCDRGYTVLLETGGHVPVDRVDSRVVKILDVKCPGSGMEASNHLDNLGLLGPRDEIKFVVRDRRDFDWAVAVVEAHGLDEKHTVLVSPVFEGGVSPIAADVAEWVRDSKRRLRLNLQVHKLLWGDVPGR
jgi:7-carboxy-7-deazaguanine synthase